MRRVTGIGGVFFKPNDPQKLYVWYEKHLGIRPDPNGAGATFHWRGAENPDGTGMTVWAIFPANTSYFGSNGKQFMVNFRVADLVALLAALRAEGVAVDDKVEEAPYGKFGWITDPEGNRIELWEPPPESSGQ